MKFSKTPFTLLLCLCLIACDKDNGNELSTDILVSRVDETINFSDEISTKVTEINESRCPTTVTCVWEGQANVFVLVETKSSDETVELIVPGYTSDTSADLDTAYIQNYAVILHSLEPYPETTSAIPLEDYKISLSVIEQ